MAKHYVYRMDHDTGFAPNTKHGLCTVCGCKRTTIEAWAKEGSWVVGIGGKVTGRPNKLIYAMEVEEALPYSEFSTRYTAKSKYLEKGHPGPNVLISRKFYYFGNNAIDLPKELTHIIIDRQGCKRVSEEDIAKLKAFRLRAGYQDGEHGKPNNPGKSC